MEAAKKATWVIPENTYQGLIYTLLPFSKFAIHSFLADLILKSKNYNSEINIKTNISNFSNGIYILKLNNEFITKIIKQ